MRIKNILGKISGEHYKNYEINNINSLRRSSDTQEYILYIVDDKYADEPDEELLLNISKFKNVLVMDGDLQHDPRDIKIVPQKPSDAVWLH